MQVTFYKGSSQERSLDLNETDHLSDARTALSNGTDAIMTSSDVFTLWSDESQRIKKLDRDDEEIVTMAEAVRRNAKPSITITDTGSKIPDMSGFHVDWLVDRNLQATVGLNLVDQEGITKNEGKFKPYIVSKIKSLGRNQYPFSDAVICEKGSVISFGISCWAGAGFGYSIGSDSFKFADSLYVTTGNQPGRQLFTGLLKDLGSGKTIIVDSWADAHEYVVGLDKIQAAYITIKAWQLKSYTQDGASFSSDLTPPRHSGGDPGGFKVDNGVVIPGDGVGTAVPHPGETTSTQPIGGIANVVEDRNAVLGQISIWFLVFNDHETAKRIIEVNDSPNI